MDYFAGDGAGVGGSAGPGASLVGVRVGVAVLCVSWVTPTVITGGGVGVGGVGDGNAMRTALSTMVRPSVRLSVQNMICRRRSFRERPAFPFLGFLADFTFLLHRLCVAREGDYTTSRPCRPSDRDRQSSGQGQTYVMQASTSMI